MEPLGNPTPENNPGQSSPLKICLQQSKTDVGVLMITNTISGDPYYKYRIVGPNTLF